MLSAHRQGIGVAEVLVDAALRAVRGMSLEDAPLPIDSPLVRTRADLNTLIAGLRPVLDSICTRWLTIPQGGTLAVVWLDRSPRADRGAYRRTSHRTCRRTHQSSQTDQTPSLWPSRTFLLATPLSARSLTEMVYEGL
jgi:hypothetical protein